MDRHHKTVAVIQARMGSTRLPGKVLLPFCGKPALWHIVRRLKSAPQISEIVVATTELDQDAPIRTLCADEGISFFSGSRDDVLDRFYQTALRFNGDPLIRITGDCPFVDPDLIGRLISLYFSEAYDHVGIATGAGAVFMDGGRFPDGLDAECFSFAALETAWRQATRPDDREHVTPYIWRNADRFRLGVLKSETDYSQLRWTLDNIEDYRLISKIYEALYSEDRIFGMQDILDYIAARPELSLINQAHIGTEGYQALWKSKNQ